jgi:hypothetical protein
VVLRKNKGSEHDLAPKEVTRARRGGAKGGGKDPTMVDLAKPVRAVERVEQVKAVATGSSGVQLGLTLTTSHDTDFLYCPLPSTLIIAGQAGHMGRQTRPL